MKTAQDKMNDMIENGAALLVAMVNGEISVDERNMMSTYDTNEWMTLNDEIKGEDNE